MNEEKVEILTLLSEISTIIGKLNNDKKLNTIKKKVTGLHKYLKKKNKTKKKPYSKTFKTSNPYISDPKKNVFEPKQYFSQHEHNTLTGSHMSDEPIQAEESIQGDEPIQAEESIQGDEPKQYLSQPEHNTLTDNHMGDEPKQGDESIPKPDESYHKYGMSSNPSLTSRD